MTFAKFCKIRGFTLEEFRQLQESIAKFVNEIVEDNRSNYGLYKEVYFLEAHNELNPYIIQECKKQGIEFYDDNKMFRVPM